MQNEWKMIYDLNEISDKLALWCQPTTGVVRCKIL